MIARLTVVDGPGTEYPIGEKVPRGWQNGAMFYPDEQVVAVTPIHVFALPPSTRKPRIEIEWGLFVVTTSNRVGYFQTWREALDYALSFGWEGRGNLPDQGVVHFHGETIETACTVVHTEQRWASAPDPAHPESPANDPAR